MTDPDWWQGDETVFNDRALDFILAVHGLQKAKTRVEDGDQRPHVFVECSWWISAATEACGRRHDGTVLEAFYWVRNKGFHETALALGLALPGVSGGMGVGLMGVSPMGGASLPPRWARLPGPADGSRKKYNDLLASRPIVETVDEAYDILLQVYGPLVPHLNAAFTVD